MAKKTYESKKLWDMEYQRTRCKMITLKLAYGTDEDIIEHIEKQGNTQGYIRRLVRQDLENSI